MCAGVGVGVRVGVGVSCVCWGGDRVLPWAQRGGAAVLPEHDAGGVVCVLFCWCCAWLVLRMVRFSCGEPARWSPARPVVVSRHTKRWWCVSPVSPPCRAHANITPPSAAAASPDTPGRGVRFHLGQGRPRGARARTPTRMHVRACARVHAPRAARRTHRRQLTCRGPAVAAALLRPGRAVCLETSERPNLRRHQVTNAHVISNASDVKVTLFDQSTYKAKVRHARGTRAGRAPPGAQPCRGPAAACGPEAGGARGSRSPVARCVACGRLLATPQPHYHPHPPTRMRRSSGATARRTWRCSSCWTCRAKRRRCCAP